MNKFKKDIGKLISHSEYERVKITVLIMCPYPDKTRRKETSATELYFYLKMKHEYSSQETSYSYQYILYPNTDFIFNTCFLCFYDVLTHVWPGYALF